MDYATYLDADSVVLEYQSFDLGIVWAQYEVGAGFHYDAATETEMKELLTTIPFSVFKRKVSELSKVQVDNLISYAVENEIVNTEKCKYLKEVTGKDILASISRNQNMEEEDKAAR